MDEHSKNSAEAITPLTWPETGEPPADPSFPPLLFYAVIMLVGGGMTLAAGQTIYFVVAAAIDGLIYAYVCRRPRAIVAAHLKNHLRARPESRKSGGNDPLPRALAAHLSRAEKQIIKGPSTLFIPADPIRLVFYHTSDID